MTKINQSVVVFALAVILFFPLILPVMAQEITPEEALAREQQEATEETEEIEITEPMIDINEPTIEENTVINTSAGENKETTNQPMSGEITDQDLDVKEAKILPDHPFYFLKNWGRVTKLFFTTNPIKRASLQLRYSNEKLMEIKQLSQNEKLDDIEQAPKIKKVIERSLDKWEKEQQAIKVEQIVSNEELAPEKDRFIQKYIDHNLKQELVLQKLENQLPTEIFEKISEKRDAHLEKFAQVMEKVEEKHASAKERLETAISNLPKDLPNQQLRLIEITKKIEENTNKAKPFIKEISQQTMKEIKEKLNDIPVEQREEKIEHFFSQAMINPMETIEIINSVREEMPNIKRELTISQEKIITNLGNKIKAMPSLEIKEDFIKGIVNDRERHLEILKTIQTKLENKLPEKAQASQMIKGVIEQQGERIENQKAERIIKMNKEGIDESVERPMPARLDFQKAEPTLDERNLRIKTQQQTNKIEQDRSEPQMIINEVKPSNIEQPIEFVPKPEPDINNITIKPTGIEPTGKMGITIESSKVIPEIKSGKNIN